MTWIDQTVRPEGEPNVEPQPGKMFEISWELAPNDPQDSSRLTILLDKAGAQALADKLRDLLIVLPGAGLCAVLW